MQKLLCTLFMIVSLGTYAQNVYEPGQLFIKIKDQSTLDISYHAESNNHYLEPYIASYGIEKIECPFILDNPQLQRTYVLEFNRIEQTQKLMEVLQEVEWVDYVEQVPNYQLFYTPNDLHPQQWNLQTVFAEQAWNIQQGNNTVVIGMVDDAVLLNHEDLGANIWVNPGEIPGDGIDNDNNGYIDDVNGWDAADNDNDPNPLNPSNSYFTHGTHCAGIAAAVTDNNIGIASLGFNTKLMAVKIGADANAQISNAYAGVQYAITAGADIISMSWGGGPYSQTYQNIMDQAHADGIVLIAAAGNSNTSTPMYPAAYNHVISVGATDVGDDRAYFSNYGSTIDVMAPGANIYSCLAGSNSSYGSQSGTSMACPLVSGLAALMLAQDPNLSPDDLEDCLESTCDNIDAQNPGYIGQLGAGRINALAALQCIKPISANFEADYTTICPGTTINFTDLTSNNPFAWEWSFPGGTPGTSNAQNPTVTYANAGTYDVTLIATNTDGSDTLTIQTYVEVAYPTATISGSASILAGYSANLRIDLTGTPPWSIDLYDGTTTTPYNNITSTPHYITVSPSVNTTYTIDAMTDNFCSGTTADSAIINIIAPTQSASCTYSNIYGDGFDNRFYDIHYDPVEDAIYATGRGNLNNASLTKIDPQGNILWNKVYSGGPSLFTQIVPADNGFIMLRNENENIVLMRVDLQGDVVWSKTYDNARERSPKIIPSTNDTYIIGSWWAPAGTGDDLMLMKIDGSGNIIWANRHHFQDDQLYDIIPNGNGGCVVTGGLHSNGIDMFVAEFDTNGNLLGGREFEQSGNSDNESRNIIKTLDGGYAVTSQINTFNNWDVSLKKLDANFNMVWERTFQSTISWNNSADDLVQDRHENLYITMENPANGANEAMVVKYDINGNFIWAKSLTDLDRVYLTNTGSVPVDNLLLWYFSPDFQGGMGDQDAFLARVDTSLNSCIAYNNTIATSTSTFAEINWTASPTSMNFTVTNNTITANDVPWSKIAFCDSCTVDTACVVINSEQKISDIEGSFTATLDDVDYFGQSVANIGDLNGDGIDDFAVGAHHDDDGGTDKGAIYILFMNANGTVNTYQKISETQGGFTGTLLNGDHFGGYIAPIGDLNNDGIVDLAVGAREDDDGGTDKGAVWILFMNTDGTVQSQQKISDTQGNFLDNIDFGAGFGTCLEPLGDFNGDGVEDIAVGATRDQDGGSRRGAFWLVYLNTDGTVNGYQKISDTQGNFTGFLEYEDYFGSGIANMGDLDGNGTIDLVVAAREDDDGGTDRGAFYTLFMNANGTVDSHQKVSATQGNLNVNLDNGDYFANRVSTLGDLNYDGVPDLLAGAPNDDDGGNNQGAAYILFMNADGTVANSHKISETTGGFNGPLDPDDQFGWEVEAVGDFNNNGYPDIAIGARADDDGGNNRGAFYLLMMEDSCNTIDPIVCNLDADFSATIACIGDSTHFTDLSTDATDNVVLWNWDFGDGNNSTAQHPSHVYGNTGTYTVTLIVGNDAVPACFDTISYTVDVVNTLSLQLTADTTICLNDSLQLTVNPACGQAPFTYSWSPAAGLSDPNIANPIASPTATTTYTVTVTDDLGATVSGTITITIDNSCCVSYAAIGLPASYCVGDSVLFINNSSTQPGATFQWNFGPNASPSSYNGQNPPPVIFNTDGLHAVTLIVSDNCGTDTAVQYVPVYPLPILDLGNDTTICTSDSIALGSTPLGLHQYSWTPTTGLSNANIANPMALVTATTTYYVTITDMTTGCSTTDSITVTVGAPPSSIGGTVEICAGDTAVLDATASGVSYLWQDGSTLPVYTTTLAGTYTVDLTNGCGTATGTFVVNEVACDSCSYNIPNIFSPNADGVNDVFHVIFDYTKEACGIEQMFIYNRWGHELFESTESNAFWDGRTKAGEVVPDGTYYYIITIDGENYSGHVMLTR